MAVGGGGGTGEKGGGKRERGVCVLLLLLLPHAPSSPDLPCDPPLPSFEMRFFREMDARPKAGIDPQPPPPVSLSLADETEEEIPPCSFLWRQKPLSSPFVGWEDGTTTKRDNVSPSSSCCWMKKGRKRIVVAPLLSHSILLLLFSLSPNGGGGRTIDGNHSSLPLPLVSLFLSRNGGEIEVGTRDVLGGKPVWEFRDFRCEATTVDNRQFSYYWLYMATRREREKTVS